MNNFTSIPEKPLTPFLRWPWRALASPWIYMLMSAGILVLDLVTGPFLMFPILFVVPVTFSAWFYSARMSFALAVILPVSRFFIAAYIEHAFPPVYAAANAVIRIVVLCFISFLVVRTARQTKELQREVTLLEGILPICMFCKKIRDEKEVWQPIES